MRYKMKNNPLVSIVVPVYNVEKYLVKCLDSLVNQTYKNTEIIIVNDGSTDGSLDIIQKYAQEDSRILIVNKVNGGLASARNAGVSVSKGEYIWHVDSDDYAELSALSKMVTYALVKNADIVVTGYYCENENYQNTGKRSSRYTGELSGNEALALMFKMKIGGEVWSKLYKRELYVRGNIKQNELYSEVEDILLNYQMFSCATRVCFLDTYTMHHIYREHSYSFGAKQILFRKNHHQGILSILKDNFISLEVEKAYCYFLFSDFLTCLSMKKRELYDQLGFWKIKKMCVYMSCLPYFNEVFSKGSPISLKLRLLIKASSLAYLKYLYCFVVIVYLRITAR